MTPERARYILANTLMGGTLRFAFVLHGNRGLDNVTTFADGITPEEDAAIRAVWRTLPGSSSYYSAVCEIANERIVAT